MANLVMAGKKKKMGSLSWAQTHQEIALALALGTNLPETMLWCTRFVLELKSLAGNKAE
jgi:hypothetical protein